MQEECNGPTVSSKSQEPSNNHTGSGDLNFTRHPLVKTHLASFFSFSFCFGVRDPQAGVCQEDSAETLLLLHLVLRPK